MRRWADSYRNLTTSWLKITYTLRKECGIYVDFPHTMRFLYLLHRIEVDNSPHNLMWLVLSTLNIKWPIQGSSSTRSRLIGNIHIHWMISFGECTHVKIFAVSCKNTRGTWYLSQCVQGFNKILRYHGSPCCISRFFLESVVPHLVHRTIMSILPRINESQ